MRPEYDNILTPLGHHRIINLGIRMRMRLKNLYEKIQNQGQSRALCTNITRTIESSDFYLRGFFGSFSKLTPKIEPQNSQTDYLLKFPDLCERYLRV
jgi:hypothetical protein